MHEQTPTVAKEVRRAKSLDDKLGLLRNRYRGETCVIVTCGPSLASVPDVRLREHLSGVLTIAVKQAIDVVGDQADFHCWNSFNVSRYKCPSDDSIRCFVPDPTGRRPQFNGKDLTFPQFDGNGGLGNSLASTQAFSDCLLANDPRRPFGPGIMYELAFYLAVHLGVAEIITIGWDIANSFGGNDHFYDHAKDQTYFRNERQGPPPPPNLRSRVPEPIRYGVRLTRNMFAHSRGQLYNRTKTLPGETEMVARSTVGLADWLHDIDVSISAVTDSPHLADNIRRLSVDDLWNRLTDLHKRKS